MDRCWLYCVNIGLAFWTHGRTGTPSACKGAFHLPAARHFQTVSPGAVFGSRATFPARRTSPCLDAGRGAGFRAFTQDRLTVTAAADTARQWAGLPREVSWFARMRARRTLHAPLDGFVIAPPARARVKPTSAYFRQAVLPRFPNANTMGGVRMRTDCTAGSRKAVIHSVE